METSDGKIQNEVGPQLRGDDEEAIGLVLVVLGLVSGANLVLVSLGVTVALGAGIADAEPVRRA